MVKAFRINKRQACFLLVVLCGGLASMAKTFGVLSGYIYQAETGLGGDWVLHALVAMVLGFSACLSSIGNKPANKSLDNPENNSLPKYSLVVLSIVLVSIDESLQAFTPTREFSVWDWVANMAGISVGCLLFALAKTVRGQAYKRKAEPNL